MNAGQARLPDGDVVVYDDRDEACRYQIARIRQWATAGQFTFVPLTDPRVAYLVAGLPVHPKDARLYGGRVFDYRFSKAPADWRVAEGVWEIANRWECDPRWSFLVGTPDGWRPGRTRNKPVVIWHKRSFPGDMAVEFFIAPRMNPTSEGLRRYEWVRDFNVTIGADGRDVSSGYTFMFAGFENTRSAILKGGKVIAETRDSRATFPRISMTAHQYWYRVRVSRSGTELRYRVYFSRNSTPLVDLVVDDPEPLTGDRVAVWSYDCSVVVARLRIAGSVDGGLEPPDFPVPERCRTPYDER